MAIEELELRVLSTEISRVACIPTCLFIAQIHCRASETTWMIKFTQKDILRLHFLLVCVFLGKKVYRFIYPTQENPPECPHLPISVYFPKLAKTRQHDAPAIEQYLQQAILSNEINQSDYLSAFLEYSSFRLQQQLYGPSLKEGYVHIKTTGAEHFPFYRCTKGCQVGFRHCYLFALKLCSVVSIVCIAVPLMVFGVVIARVPFIAEEEESQGEHVLLVILSICGIIFVTAFGFKFFQRRLGTVRRWAVLKPTCLATFKYRGDTQPSEVFLFDEDFAVAKGSYRQGVSWMPNGLTVASRAGVLELDTGVYYTRFTSLIATLLVALAIFLLTSSVAVNVHDVNYPQDRLQSIENAPPRLRDADACGLYFRAPRSIILEGLEDDVLIDEYSVADQTDDLVVIRKSQLSPVLPILQRGLPSLTTVNSFERGTIVGLTRPRTQIQQFGLLPDALAIVDDVQLQIRGLHNSPSQKDVFNTTDTFCAIAFRVSRYNSYYILYIILMFLFGGVLAITFSLLINYGISYLGIWHANLRRDHWFAVLQEITPTEPHRYDSFAPAHVINATKVSPSVPAQHQEASGMSPGHSKLSPEDCGVAWYVDGDNAYAEIANALESAEREIFIAAWWLCPELFLRRPVEEHPESMIKTILLRKAEQGVKIYIMLYREIKVALTLDSVYTKRQLNIHENIRILRDPEFQLQDLGFWSHHEKIVCIDQWIAFVGGLDLCFGRYDTATHSLQDGKLEQANHYWPGKDYSNPRVRDFVQVNRPFEDLIDRETTPRMPWHDVHCSVSGPAAMDIAWHFIQRWNFVCAKKQNHLRTGFCICCRNFRFKYLPRGIVPYYKHNFVTPVRSPRCSEHPSSPEIVVDLPLLEESHRGCEVSRHRVDHPVHHRRCNVQVLRSVSQWSAGVPTESSIQKAYIELIQHAKHSIYIENQFFISGLNANPIVMNRIVQALVNRIKTAVREKEIFRVYVVMPLLPAFEGSVDSNELTNLHAVMHWQFQTICRGPFSLFGELAKFTAFPHEFVSFYGLRTSDVMPDGKLTTEQIYIHSKLMIVDDEKAIIGSANINDRSMNGNRDSEIAVLLESKSLCQSLRLQLFQEHLGLTKQQLSNVTEAHADETWEFVQSTAQRNTDTYQQLFNCAPSNTMTTFYNIGDCELIEFFENQRFHPLNLQHGHLWNQEHLKPSDYAPWTDANGVPVDISKINQDDYVVDTEATIGALKADHDGWIFARNFSVFQECRIATSRIRKRDRLQHFMTDRLLAQVRRRRWVKKSVYYHYLEQQETTRAKAYDSPDRESYKELRTPHSMDKYRSAPSSPTKAQDFQQMTQNMWQSFVDKFPRSRSMSRASHDDFRQPYEQTPDPAIQSFRSLRALSDTDRRSYAASTNGSTSGGEGTQLGQIHTFTTATANDSADQLSKIHGHLVVFPLDFLKDEILKPSILPRDIHI